MFWVKKKSVFEVIEAKNGEIEKVTDEALSFGMAFSEAFVEPCVVLRGKGLSSNHLISEAMLWTTRIFADMNYEALGKIPLAPDEFGSEEAAAFHDVAYPMLALSVKQALGKGWSRSEVFHLIFQFVPSAVGRSFEIALPEEALQRTRGRMLREVERSSFADDVKAGFTKNIEAATDLPGIFKVRADLFEFTKAMKKDAVGAGA